MSHISKDVPFYDLIDDENLDHEKKVSACFDCLVKQMKDIFPDIFEKDSKLPHYLDGNSKLAICIFR